MNISALVGGSHIKLQLKWNGILCHEEEVFPVYWQPARLALVQRNRQKLRSVAATILLHGRQGIVLKGHCDDGLDVQNSTITRHGISRLYYVFASMLEMNCSSTTWKQQGKMHYTLANEMIVTGGEIIRRKIIANR